MRKSQVFDRILMGSIHHIPLPTLFTTSQNKDSQAYGKDLFCPFFPLHWCLLRNPLAPSCFLLTALFPAFLKRNKMASVCSLWAPPLLTTSLLDLFTSPMASSTALSFPKKCPAGMKSDQWKGFTQVTSDIVNVRSYIFQSASYRGRTGKSKKTGH